MAYTTIDDPSAYFQTALYTGNGSTQSIVNDGNSDLQPDWIWIKERSAADDHKSYDSSRGTAKKISQNDGSTEESQEGVTAFNSDGFSLGSHAGSNQSSQTYVAWQWKMNSGSTTSGGGTDSAGTSSYQANTTAGQSIVTYTGTGSSMTVAHGLGAVPAAIFIKKRTDDTENWRVYHKEGYRGGSYGQQQSGGQLNVNNAFDHGANSYWDNTSFTSTLFTVKDNATVNDNTDTYVAYCFAEIQGYSKFGAYVGNGNVDGPFIYTGFKPAWIMFKSTDTTGSWQMYDSTRETFNDGTQPALKADDNGAEFTKNVDILSNGVKLRDTTSDANSNGTDYVYFAFAESPFVSSEGVPTTAR